MRKLTGITAVIGFLLVLSSMLSRYFDLLPQRSRTTVLIIGITVMFLSSIWRVVIDTNADEED